MPLSISEYCLFAGCGILLNHESNIRRANPHHILFHYGSFSSCLHYRCVGNVSSEGVLPKIISTFLLFRNQKRNYVGWSDYRSSSVAGAVRYANSNTSMIVVRQFCSKTKERSGCVRNNDYFFFTLIFLRIMNNFFSWMKNSVSLPTSLVNVFFLFLFNFFFPSKILESILVPTENQKKKSNFFFFSPFFEVREKNYKSLFQIHIIIFCVANKIK